MVIVNTQKLVVVLWIFILGPARFVVDEILGKDAEVQEKGDERAGEPAEVDEHVFAVDASCLAGLARRTPATGVVGEDGEDKCDVP